MRRAFARNAGKIRWRWLSLAGCACLGGLFDIGHVFGICAHYVLHKPFFKKREQIHAQRYSPLLDALLHLIDLCFKLLVNLKMFLGGVAFGAIPAAITKLGEEGILAIKGTLYKLI